MVAPGKTSRCRHLPTSREGSASKTLRVMAPKGSGKFEQIREAKTSRKERWHQRPATAGGLVLAVLLAGCPPEPVPACVPGSTQACACTGGRSGVQTCSAAGAFGACDCEDEPDDPDAGGLDAGERLDARAGLDAPSFDAPISTEPDAPGGPDAPTVGEDAPLAPIDAPGLDPVVSDAAVIRDDAFISPDTGLCIVGTSRPCPGASDVGECVAGTQTCDAAGRWGTCVGRVDPGLERCNGLDDDCDGTADGPVAATTCAAVPAATTLTCTSGACAVATCMAGYADCDGLYSNGCEAALGTTSHCMACGDTCDFRCSPTGCDDAVQVTTASISTYGHSCARTASGAVFCWGSNSWGQLGDGTFMSRLLPVRVSSLPAVSHVEAGWYTTCALTTGGDVYCWGSNTDGLFGGATSVGTSTATPTRLATTGVVRDIGLSGRHLCIVTAAGGLRCSGNNSDGQLGDGTSTNRVTFVDAFGLTGVTGVHAGGGHTCVESSGGFYCMGSNGWGQFGNGTIISSLLPTRVAALDGFDAMFIGDSYSCGRTAGSPRCWGYNGFGRLGDGTTTYRASPVPVFGVPAVTTMQAGSSSSCAVLPDGTVRCWGDNSWYQLGDGTRTSSLTPVTVVGVTGAMTLGASNGGQSSGRGHYCAATGVGAVRCWGDNSSGQLGDGTTMVRVIASTVTVP